MKFLRYLIFYLIWISLSASVSARSDDATFVTWDSLEPDKWASIWLIKQHIAPTAKIEVRKTGEKLDSGIAFGVPKATYRRTGDQSTFESLMKGYQLDDSSLEEMGRLITAIETTSWSVSNDPKAHAVEQSFRRLQDRFGRHYVPINCYGGFFDAFYKSVAGNLSATDLEKKLDEAVQSQTCELSEAQMAVRIRSNRVAELPIEALMNEISQGKKVVFVDTREPQEFAEGHIPSAVNIPMRDLTPDVYEQLKKADRVISYCVKDFRGYEVARKMLQNGVHTVAVMKPYGLAGWKSKKLPLTTESPKSLAAFLEADNSETLTQCARDLDACASQ